MEVRPRLGEEDPVQRFHEQNETKADSFRVDDWFKADHTPTIPKQETLHDIRRREFEQRSLYRNQRLSTNLVNVF